MIEVCGNTRHAYLLTFLTVKMFPNSSRIQDRIRARGISDPVIIRINRKSSTGMLPQITNGTRNSRFIAALCSNLRRRRRGFLDRSNTKNSLPMLCTCSALRAYATRKGKEGKAWYCANKDSCQ